MKYTFKKLVVAPGILKGWKHCQKHANEGHFTNRAQLHCWNKFNVGCPKKVACDSILNVKFVNLRCFLAGQKVVNKPWVWLLKNA